MRIIAVDNERAQLDTVTEYLARIYPNADIKAFTEASDALEHMESEGADLAVLESCLNGEISGIRLGEMLREKNQRIKLLYCSACTDHAMDAFKLHANGYLQKPVDEEILGKELEYIMKMPVFGGGERPYIRTFGNFDVFCGERPVVFKRSKSKEVLAYLCDRHGAWVTNKDLLVILWEETGQDALLTKYIPTVVRDMELDLMAAGIGHIIERLRGKLRILVNEVECDYFDYLGGSRQAAGAFYDEYMSQYSWAEDTLAALISNK